VKWLSGFDKRLATVYTVGTKETTMQFFMSVTKSHDYDAACEIIDMTLNPLDITAGLNTGRFRLLQTRVADGVVADASFGMSIVDESGVEVAYLSESQEDAGETRYSNYRYLL
jgi:hypothetical protein